MDKENHREPGRKYPVWVLYPALVTALLFQLLSFQQTVRSSFLGVRGGRRRDYLPQPGTPAIWGDVDSSW